MLYKFAKYLAGNYLPDIVLPQSARSFVPN